MKMQNILMMRTQSSGFSSQFTAQANEWRTLSDHKNYRTPLEALQDGWKLLAPPTKLEKEYDPEQRLEWWFVKE